ncbi:hypothetical protein H6P81_013206 [Aristolochia fimbriata]|uniref:Uncharacterized protein n=1 Tax=Aristolochia fimbriata TaxID=158543 RepID=A0AAV7EIQ2_ARIFI|nr:hypothetical protein H6P81_013206 [Aristolochia fimbriata]
MDWKGKPISKEKHGGSRAAWFIYFMVATTSTIYMPNLLDMVLYLRKSMHMGIADSATTIANLVSGTCAFSLLGGFLSDSYITRFKAILIFGPFEVLGFGLLALQAHFPSLHPPKCDSTDPESNCREVHGYNAALLYTAMYTVAFGEGCLRANLASFGGDQFDDEDPAESRKKSSFFNWFGFSTAVGNVSGLILIVWIENNKGWAIGFALSALLLLVGLTVLASGFAFYSNQRPRGSPLTRMLQVFVAAFKNRKLDLPPPEELLHQEVLEKEEIVIGEVLPHTEGLKCLDKASIIGGNADKWSLCPITQVEETKVVVRMLPIFISSVLGYIPIPLLFTLTVQQGSAMNTQLGHIRIATPSLLIIPLIFQMLLLVLYDRFFVPLARKLTGLKTGITHLQRIGVGFLFTATATSIAALIEMKRKRIAKEHGMPMTVMWVAIQFLAVGITEVCQFVGLLEFFNSEVSRGMKSLGTAIFWCMVGLASLLGSVLIDAVNGATSNLGGPNNNGWLEGNNLNKSYLDRFYWLLSLLELLSFLNYLYWAKRYVYRRDPRG